MFTSFIKSTLVSRGIRYYFRKLNEFFRTLFFHFIYPNDFKALKALKDKHKDEPCVLIGGGPSLNKMNLEKLQGFVTIACNGFYLKMDELHWSPTYYTVEDPLPAEDNQKEISRLCNTTKVIPVDLKKFISRDKNTIYCNFRRSYLRPGRKNYPKFSFDFTKQSFWGGTVMFYNLQLAAHLGCNPIYLVGVDLNYKIPKDVSKSGAVLLSNSDDENHFHPKYFGKGKRWHLPETDRMQKCFTKAYIELTENDFKVYNAGIDSKLKDIPKQSVI
ncbi:MAG: hypothetical protein CMC19_05320 [Flavobacteriaceae bacterium]|nr:hypothetical protein [Flavobacteriaceae bacterium]